MKIKILVQVSKELNKIPINFKMDILGTLKQLESGYQFKMPFCRSLNSIIRGLYELRYSYKAGEYRVFYYTKIGDAIYVIHAMKKKSQKISQKTINLLKSRIRSVR